MTGVEILPSSIHLAKEFIPQSDWPNLTLICNNIFDCRGFNGKFDIILMKDTIEHIQDQNKLMSQMRTWLKSEGVIFQAFPPWVNPFGGHQQMCKSRVLSRLPWLHLLPRSMYRGILALFGEKYGDTVRVVIMDPNYSIELCGGTHIGATGELGLFKLKHESAVAAGVRRIEAVCGEGAITQVNEALAELEAIKELVKNTKEPVKAVQQIVNDVQSLKKRVESYEALALIGIKKELEAKVTSIGDTHFIGSVVTVSNPDGLKKLCTELQGSFTNLLVVLAANIEGKAAVAVLVDDTLNNAKGLEAQKIIKDQIAPLIKGGGGGQKGLATAGGQDSSNLIQVIESVKNLLN